MGGGGLTPCAVVRARSRAPEHACWEEYRAEGARRQPRLFPLYYREAVYSRQVSLAPGTWHPDHALQEGLLRQAEARLASRIKVTMARKAALTKLKDESVAAVFPRVEEVYPTMFVRDLFLRLTEPLVAVSKEDVMVLTLEGGQEGPDVYLLDPPDPRGRRAEGGGGDHRAGLPQGRGGARHQA